MSKVPSEIPPIRSAESINTLTSDVELDGEIHSKGTLIFDGRLNGGIHAAAELVVGANARIKGEIHAGAVTIYGQIIGNVTATERILAKSGAEVQGDLISKRLSMEEGVIFVGSSKISPK